MRIHREGCRVIPLKSRAAGACALLSSGIPLCSALVVLNCFAHKA